MTKRAVVLLSGGLDSTTCLAMAKAAGFEPVCLGIAYGQRHSVELERARKVAQVMGVTDVRVVTVDLRQIGGSALTADIPVPKDRSDGEMSHEIPVTYVPARNALFLSMALGLAEVVGATDIYIGVNAVDYSGYPDCRPEFIRSFESMANLATKAGVEGARFTVHAPLSGLTKAQIIQEGVRLGVDYGLTHSCYDPDTKGRACGRCDSCLLRKKGFEEAGVPDPTPYTDGV
ncbi:7-cyano-7-deazaguanine synthase QueC [Corallococcus sp. H22C18031201]|uniref:7-cyano-7-deazaguanine synthase QueC n=1 Tax=Citreicoccus inhibens TaxID=2849499 RepID=UPI000E7413CB|nr:7-cyano-7-deazaguanine synthase QueC [Citreicoccus inhibens]MBU8895493.1 7-cyano-7-deazaguanine synthase QueC [Citreicoccus inhibens]RJS22478.1 7-cyano-7-deazaguanine synthase QueC [Corallococcus sp. H22C18031201]